MKLSRPRLQDKEEKHTMKREREGIQRPWIAFLIFCCSSNVLVSRVRFYSCVFGMRPLFRAHPKMGRQIFVSLYISLTGVLHSSLPRRVSQPTLLSNPSYPFTYLCGRGRNVSFPVDPHMLRIFGTSGFFLVLSDYRSHSLVTGWPATRAFA